MNAIQWTASQIGLLCKHGRKSIPNASRKALEVRRDLDRPITSFDVAEAHGVAIGTASDWLKQARETGVLVCVGRRRFGKSSAWLYDTPKRTT